MKKILFLLFFSVQAQATSLEDFLQNIVDQCPSAKVLAVKKSLIEMGANPGCSGPFTQIVLQDCPQLNCESFITSFDKVFKKEQGRVIGR